MNLVKKIRIALCAILAAIPAGAQNNSASMSRDAMPVILTAQELVTLGETYADIVAKFGVPTIEFPLAEGGQAVWYDHSKFILKDGKLVSYELLDPAGAERALAQQKQHAAQFGAETTPMGGTANKQRDEMEAQRKAETDRIAREKQEREKLRIAAELKRMKLEQEKQALRGRWAAATNSYEQQGRTNQFPDTSIAGTSEQNEAPRPVDEIRYDMNYSAQTEDGTNSYIRIDIQQLGGDAK